MPAKATRVPTGREGMNKLESDYAAFLAGRKDVAWWRFECFKLRLANGAFYTPDFLVVLSDGTVEVHETKGFFREAARVRLKVAVETYPFVFRLVKRLKRNEGWDITDVTR